MHELMKRDPRHTARRTVPLQVRMRLNAGPDKPAMQITIGDANSIILLKKYNPHG